MKQANLIKISKFQTDDGGLLLICKTDDLPFLVVDEKGVVFDDGPFIGAFCALEGLSKFIVKGKREAVCTLQLKFAEGDIYPIGRFSSRDPQYNEALRWVITANKKIAQKNGTARGYSNSFADAIIGIIATCVGKDEESLKTDTDIVAALDSLEKQNLIHEAEERFSIFLPESIFAQIRTIGDLIAYVNALVEDETDFLPQNSTRTTEISPPEHAHTTRKLLQ